MLLLLLGLLFSLIGPGVMLDGRMPLEFAGGALLLVAVVAAADEPRRCRRAILFPRGRPREGRAAYCRQPHAIPRLDSDLHANILDVFNEYGVQIMTPVYGADTPEPKLVRRSDWWAAPAKAPDAPDPSR